MAARAYIRFTNVNIPQYAAIDSAYIEVTSYGDFSSLLNVNIYVVSDANPANPTSKAELNSLSVTGGKNWNIVEQWENGSTYTSPSLSAGIQDIVNLDDWNSGNPIMVIIENNGDVDSRRFSAFEDGITKCTKLYITYTEPVSTAKPYYSPLPGNYNTDNKNVEIFTSTNNANIYYTTDGSTPTTSSNLYSGAVGLTTDTTLKAIAFKSGGGYTISDISSGYYNLIDIFRPSTGTDDGYVDTVHTTFNNGSISLYFLDSPVGGLGPFVYKTFCRFQLDIPQGSTINSAIFRFYSNITHGSSCRKIISIKAVDDDDAVAPTNYTEFINLSYIGTEVLWDYTFNLTVPETFDSEDITSIIQAIVNRPGWSSGNHIVLTLEEDSHISGLNFLYIASLSYNGKTSIKYPGEDCSPQLRIGWQ